MLVLSRKTNERVRIGENVWVTVVRVGPNNVRLGFEGPREIPFVREELVPTAGAVRAHQVAGRGR